MTKDEVRANNSMLSVVRLYGFHPNRAGFISCPFHKCDRSPSFKIYSDSFNCFGCGAQGDVFTFVMRMDGVSFKEAFFKLGGTYKAPTFESNLAIYRAKKEKQKRQQSEQAIKAEKDWNNKEINYLRLCMSLFEPLSDLWCELYNLLQIELYHHERLNYFDLYGEEVPGELSGLK